MAEAWIYVTAGSRDEALEIGRTLVKERVAACANVLPSITSVYWWEGAVQENAEAALILKTREALVDKVTARVRELHSYDCPCVVALQIAGGNRAFLDWIDRETR